MSRPTLSRAGETGRERVALRYALEELLVLYFHALDSRQFDLLESVFTDDATAIFNHRTGPARAKDGSSTHQLRGKASIVAMLRDGTARLELTGGQPVASMMHILGNLRLIVATADEAESESYAIVFLTHERRGKPRMIVRGLRYRDRFALTPEGWRITARVHSVEWMTTAALRSPISWPGDATPRATKDSHDP